LHPSPNESLDQWAELAQRLVGVVRAVDPHRLIVIERAPVIACNYELPAWETFAAVSGPNLAYSTYFDWPFAYTGQLLPSFGQGDGGAYPDNTLPTINWDHMTWEAWSLDSRPSAQALRLPAGDSDWTEQRFTYTVTDPDYQIAQVAFTSDHNSSDAKRGTAYFDDLTVKEYDEDRKLVRTVFDVDLESCANCYLYEGLEGGVELEANGEFGTSPEHHRGEASITISYTTTFANITMGHLFPVTLGHTYEVSGWAKGDNLQPDSETFIRIDFYSYAAELDLRTRDTLRRQLQAYYEVARDRGVPLFIEFGIGRPAFEDDKGGLRWVEDVLDFVVEERGHFSYDGYHGDEYGIYGGSDDLPEASDVNQPLVDLFTKKLLDSKREP
jgi:endoglucanase